MRRTVLPLVLAAGLASTVALAANDKVNATFESLSASGITGEAQLNPMRQGGTLIHGSLRGLQPSTEYVSFIFPSGGCATGTATAEIVRFTANPAGVANFNKRVPQTIAEIKSISVQTVSDLAVQACASVTP